MTCTYCFAGLVSSHRDYREKLRVLIQWVGLSSGVPMPPPPSSTIDENPLRETNSTIKLSHMIDATKSAVSAGEALIYSSVASGLKLPGGLRSPLGVCSPVAEAETSAYTHGADGASHEAAIVRRRKATEAARAVRRLDEDLLKWGIEEETGEENQEDEDIWREAFEEAQRAHKLSGTFRCCTFAYQDADSTAG
jgi:hypothetical protein